MRVYYNDNDSFVCDWLHNLMVAGEIPKGEIDDRPIEQVQPHDVIDFDQVHLFAGIGGWVEALRRARLHDRFIWTASCPCPPFSAAGKKRTCPRCQSEVLVWCPGRTGFAICADCGHAWLADARHLWPEVWRLLAFCRPECVAGEQVAGPAAVDWLAAVCASLEILHYDSWEVDIPASSVGAPNIRQRIAWVADAQDLGREWTAGAGRAAGDGFERRRRLVDATGARLEAGDAAPGSPDEVRQEGRWEEPARRGGDGGMVNPDRAGSRTGHEAAEATGHRPPASTAGRVGDPFQPRLEGHGGDGDGGSQSGRVEAEPGGPSAEAGAHGGLADTGGNGRIEGTEDVCGREPEPAGGGEDSRVGHAEGGNQRRVWEPGEGREVEAGRPGFWDDHGWVLCQEPDGDKWRPVEPGTFPLAYGVPKRVGRLRGYGNAINPEQFAAFLEAGLT